MTSLKRETWIGVRRKDEHGGLDVMGPKILHNMEAVPVGTDSEDDEIKLRLAGSEEAATGIRSNLDITLDCQQLVGCDGGEARAKIYPEHSDFGLLPIDS